MPRTCAARMPNGMPAWSSPCNMKVVRQDRSLVLWMIVSAAASLDWCLFSLPCTIRNTDRTIYATIVDDRLSSSFTSSSVESGAWGRATAGLEGLGCAARRTGVLPPSGSPVWLSVASIWCAMTIDQCGVRWSCRVRAGGKVRGEIQRIYTLKPRRNHHPSHVSTCWFREEKITMFRQESAFRACRACAGRRSLLWLRPRPSS